ncbi:MAG: DUF2147 domain-containing protein [Fusobacteriaceae bacterium]
MKVIEKYFLILFLITASKIFAEDPYIGYFKMLDGNFIIAIEKIDQEYLGYVKWLQFPIYPKGDSMEGMEQVDRKNPDPSLRNRKVMDLQIIGGLKLNKRGTALVDGWIYDSWSGKKYYGTARVIDENTLILKGSLDRWGILGYSMKVKRVDVNN